MIWDAFWLTGCKSKDLEKPVPFEGFLKIWGLEWMPNRRNSGQVGCVASKLGCHGRSWLQVGLFYKKLEAR